MQPESDIESEIAFKVFIFNFLKSNLKITRVHMQPDVVSEKVADLNLYSR